MEFIIGVTWMYKDSKYSHNYALISPKLNLCLWKGCFGFIQAVYCKGNVIQSGIPYFSINCGIGSI